MAKLGMKPFSGILKVTLKKQGSVVFVINRPDVYKNPNSDTYIVFGEAKVEDLSNASAINAAKQFEGLTTEGTEEAPTLVEAEKEKKADSSEQGVDESGLEKKDIELVMNQANVSRSKAVAALRKTSGDIVNAIMELTMTQ